ncbi:MAG: hypothetical protein HWE13_05190 [Gammaproteobacteria bacterium]|nr:hypothetical protein [Gammaproteobacteria bacterium]
MTSKESLSIGLISSGGEETQQYIELLQQHAVVIDFQLSPQNITADHIGNDDLNVWLLDIEDHDWTDELDDLLDQSRVPVFFHERGSLTKQTHPHFWVEKQIERLYEMAGLEYRREPNDDATPTSIPDKPDVAAANEPSEETEASVSRLEQATEELSSTLLDIAKDASFENVAELTKPIESIADELSSFAEEPATKHEPTPDSRETTEAPLDLSESRQDDSASVEIEMPDDGFELQDEAAETLDSPLSLDDTELSLADDLPADDRFDAETLEQSQSDGLELAALDEQDMLDSSSDDSDSQENDFEFSDEFNLEETATDHLSHEDAIEAAETESTDDFASTTLAEGESSLSETDSLTETPSVHQPTNLDQVSHDIDSNDDDISYDDFEFLTAENTAPGSDADLTADSEDALDVSDATQSTQTEAAPADDFSLDFSLDEAELQPSSFDDPEPDDSDLDWDANDLSGFDFSELDDEPAENTATKQQEAGLDEINLELDLSFDESESSDADSIELDKSTLAATDSHQPQAEVEQEPSAFEQEPPAGEQEPSADSDEFSIDLHDEAEPAGAELTAAPSNDWQLVDDSNDDYQNDDFSNDNQSDTFSLESIEDDNIVEESFEAATKTSSEVDEDSLDWSIDDLDLSDDSSDASDTIADDSVVDDALTDPNSNDDANSHAYPAQLPEADDTLDFSEQSFTLEAEATESAESAMAFDDVPLLDDTAVDLEFEALQEPQPERGPDQHIWVLGASLGGPAAVKRFLQAVPGTVNTAFVLAQHIDENFLPVLCNILDTQTAFRSVIVDGKLKVQSGRIYIAPIGSQIRFDDEGCVEVIEQTWTPPYAPCIDDVIEQTAKVYRDKCGVIIFSGMGDDGTRGVQKMQSEKLTVWTQSSDTCANSSMPDSVTAAGLSQFSGSPEQLAENLSEYLDQRDAMRA